MRTILIVIGLCALSLAGRAQDIRISEIGYDSVRTRFYVTLENHIDGIISLLPVKPDLTAEMYNHDKTFKNLTYGAYRVKDKDGTVIKTLGPYWFMRKKGYDYFVLPRAKECYPLANRTFF